MDTTVAQPPAKDVERNSVVLLDFDQDDQSLDPLVHVGAENDLIDQMEEDFDMRINLLAGKKYDKWRRRRDHLQWVLGLGNVAFTAYCVAGLPLVMPWFYVVKFVVLMVIRCKVFFAKNFHYFLADFCYYANTLLVVLIVFQIHSAHLFIVIFALANGPLAWAVVVYRNSLVLHNLDKLTSCLIHITPPIVTFTMRWHAHDPAYAVCENAACTIGYEWTTLVPLGAFVAHQICYLILVQLLPHKRLREDKTILTSYRYLMSDKRSLVYKLVTCAGNNRNLRVLMFGVVQATGALIFLLPTWLFYNYYVAHLIFLLYILTTAAYNGASFYFRVFVRQHAEEALAEMNKKKQKQKQ